MIFFKSNLVNPCFRRYAQLNANNRFFSCLAKVSGVNCFDIISYGNHKAFLKCYKLTIKRQKSGKEDLSSIVIPVPVTQANSSDDINVGEELTKKIKKDDLLKIVIQFFKQPEINIQAAENGLDSKLYHRAAVSFRKFCMESETLPVDLHIVFSDILQGAGHLHDIFPYFLQHARQIFPHLECMEELKNISDLRQPFNWYPDARSIPRKLIFHAGPTNSGKTYHALERFMISKSGVYCGPLKLLVAEVYNKTNEQGTPCDMITGEEHQHVLPENAEAPHLACTIEMVSVEKKFEVAIIDEIQMIRDPSRGWAWTRALLGLAADEIHLCGETSAIDLVREIASTCGEELEVRRYERLTSLTVENSALVTLSDIKPGDCIVCFSKNDIFSVSLELEKKGYECAVIYGSLPPGTKLAQAKKFNDPNHSCKILVATDAIGMGLNLSIRRVIFYSLIKPSVNEKGEKELDTISTSQALQIAGRAGRFNTQFSEGFVTTLRNDDLTILKSILAKPVDPIEKAGLHPTADQVELFAYHLPHASLSNLICNVAIDGVFCKKGCYGDRREYMTNLPSFKEDIFVSLCVMDTSFFFMCDTESFKFLADMIQHVPLPLRARYVFCCAPINKKLPFVCTMFLKFSKQYSQNEPLTVDRLCRTIGWPFSAPQNIVDLVHQEAVFDVLDLYLWLSYRFPDLFPDITAVRSIQHELDTIIQQGVFNITHLLKSGTPEDPFDTDENDPQKKYNNQDGDYLKANMHHKKHLHVGKGRLTKQLLSQGLLTPKMLSELQKEWETSLSHNNNDLNAPEEEWDEPKSKYKTPRSYSRKNKKK